MRAFIRALTIIAVLVALSPIDAHAAEPWTLTLEERLDRRYDPERAAERIRANVELMRSHRTAEMQSTDLKPAGFVIDGSRDPEVFMPSELLLFLFDWQAHADLTRHRIMRDVYAKALANMGWDPTLFWADIDEHAAPYLQLIRDHVGPVRDAQTKLLLCRARHELLQAMRKRYERFDEFLYAAVAPRHSVAGAEAAPRERVLWVEQGCK